jgi:cytochrome c peroxidase
MARMSRLSAALALFLTALLSVRASDQSTEVKVPLGLPAIPWPKDNPYTPEKAELGRLLFFDPRLSADFSVTCASCHSPKFGFSDGAPVSTGIRGQKGTRSAPTVLNSGYILLQFWDGRSPTLEDQVKGPMANPIEMGTSHEIVVNRLQTIAGYRPYFNRAFGTDEINIDHVAKAIATFERTLLSGNSAYDRYKAGDKKAMTNSQIRGMDIFFKKAKCDKCHEGSNFTDSKFHNLGVGTDASNPDAGRFVVTNDPKDWGAFKTPTLREIAFTAPYMHDGSLKNLRQVVEFYDKGGLQNKNLDADVKRLKLSDRDKEDLVEFMRALSGEGWQNIKPPERTPE